MGWTILLNDAGEHVGYAGDEPWDIMGIALTQIVKLWQERYGRPPNDAELEQVINFTLPEEIRNLEVAVNLKK